MTPLLTLVSPTGMTQDERKGWMHAAYLALGDIDPDHLGDAVREAMRTVDHPSKIVPAIRKSLDGPARYQSRVTIAPPSAQELRAIEESRKPSPHAKEMSELMRGLRERLEANGATA